MVFVMTSTDKDSLVQMAKDLRKMISDYSQEELQERDRAITSIATHLEEVHSSIPFYQEKAAVLGKQYWRDLAEVFYH